MRKSWIGLAALLLSLTVVASACSSDDDGGGAVESSAADTGGDLVPGAAAIGIANTAFEPNVLPVASGSTEITITNADAVDHTFTLDDMSVNETIAAGGSATVTVDLTESVGLPLRDPPVDDGHAEVA